VEGTTYALSATPKQIAYARSLALRNQTLLPWDVRQDRRSLSTWIEAQARLKPVSEMDRLPTSRQVAFAEKLARIKRRAVPVECFRDKGLFGEVWDWAGIYRLTEKNIGVQVWHISTKLRTCLDDARYWRDHKSFDPLKATARLHHRLVLIHPFANGSGRWARIMADACLAKIDPDIFLDWSGGGTLNVETGHRSAYIAVLKR